MLSISQTCDGCLTSRGIPIDANVEDVDTIKLLAKKGGWVAVNSTEHLCAKCIRKAMHK